MLALLLLLPGSVQEPAKPDLVVNVDWAFGRVVAGAWQSVLVDLQNATPKDRELRVEALEEMTGTTVARTEAVPGGGRRRFHLTIPVGGSGRQLSAMQVRVRVLDAAGKELAVRTLGNTTGWSPNPSTLAILTRDRTVEGALRIPRRLGESEVVAVFPSTRTFPDHWSALSEVRVLALHDAPLSELLPEQARAILDYARRGGTVLLSPGAQREWFSHPVIAALAEIRVGEPERRTSLPAFGIDGLRDAFLWHPIRNGNAVEPAGSGETARPLALQAARTFECGFGRVIALPFDIALPPVAGSAGLETLWTSALADRGGTGLAAPELDLRTARTALVSLVNPYPSFGLLVGISALYLAAVGPLNYLLLRRLRMTILLVLTVPLISFLFLGGVLGLGYVLKGSTTLACSVRLLRTAPDRPVALETQLATLFSPESRSYRVSFPRDRAALPLDRFLAQDLSQHRPLSVTQGNEIAFAPVAIEQWQTWPVAVLATADLGRGVGFRSADGTLTVSNRSPLAIARAIHVRRVAERTVGTPIGAVDPGAEAGAALATARWAPRDDLGFGPGSVGGALIEDALNGFLSRQSFGGEGPELLLCVLADDSPRLEVDAREPGRERSVTLLAVWKEGR